MKLPNFKNLEEFANSPDRCKFSKTWVSLFDHNVFDVIEEYRTVYGHKKLVRSVDVQEIWAKDSLAELESCLEQTRECEVEDRIRSAQNMLDSLDGSLLHGTLELLSETRGHFTEWRSEERVIYPLDAMILIILLAKLCKQNTAEEIVDFYRYNYLQLYVLIGGLPPPRYQLCPATINIVLGTIKSDELELYLTKYFSQIKASLSMLIAAKLQRQRPETARAITYAIDGQEHRRSFVRGRSRRTKASITVSVYDCTNKITKAVASVDKKNNEAICFLSKLASRIDVRGAAFMWDAINTRYWLTSYIVEHGGNYLCIVKRDGGNRELKDCIEKLFKRERANPNSPMIRRSYHHDEHDEIDPEVNHGRIEDIDIEILPATMLPSHLQTKHKGLKTIVHKVKRTQHVRDGVISKPEISDRFYISSFEFTEANADQIKASILDYWAIEQHHSRKDDPKCFNQDSVQSCNKNYLSNVAAFNSVAYNILTYARARLSLIRGSSRPMTYSAVQNRFNSHWLAEPMMYIISYFLRKDGCEGDLEFCDICTAA